jgi:glycosyltransferase involved in cell wall biosynthesis
MIVGDGPERITLERYVSSYKVPAVRFLGAVSWREVPKLFACADVLVIPSTSEPWGLVINEAMACGMPVIASANCGACDDLVRNGVNGIVFNPYSKEDLCSALQMFVSEEELIDRMGHASLEVIAMFTPQDAAKRMFQGIEDVLGRAR